MNQNIKSKKRQCTFYETSDGKTFDNYYDAEYYEKMKLFKKYEKEYDERVMPIVEGNIFKSVENVNLDTVICYKSIGERHHFLDRYDE